MLGRWAALAAIGAYQRWLSPYKGFCCAYRAHTGAASCSALAARAVRRHGAVAGWRITRKRLARCGAMHRQHSPRRAPRQQRGDCDIGCDGLSHLPCDAPCSCDWPGRTRDPPPTPKPKRDRERERPAATPGLPRSERGSRL